MSNPNQEIIESRLATYIDGELDPSERLEIEQHLQQNPQYRRLIDDLRKQRDMLRGLPREAAPLDMAEAFTNQLERSVLLDEQVNTDDSRRRIYAFPRIFAAAAIVLLTVGLAVIVYFVLPDHNARQVVLAPAPKAPAPVVHLPSDETASKDTTGDSPAAPTPDEPTKSLVEKVAGGGANNAVALAQPLKPEAAAKPTAPVEQKNSAREEVASNLGTTLNRGQAEHLFERSRDAELDQLAKNVSNDPQVKGLFATDNDAKRAAGAGETLPNAGRVLVVRASDPQQVEKQLAKFFSQDNIDWRPAPQRVELALNTSLSQQSDDALAANGTANKRKIDVHAVDEYGRLPEAEKQSTVARQDAPAPAPPSSPAPAPISPTPGPATPEPAEGAAPTPAAPGAAPLQAQARPAPGNLANARSPAPTIAPTKPENAKGASAKAAEVAAASLAEPRAFALKATESFSDRGLQQANQTSAEQREKLAPNSTPVDNLYVARRLSRRQAEALNAFLAQDGEVRKADVSLRLGEYRYAAAAPASDPNAVGAKIAPPAPRTSAAALDSKTLHDATTKPGSLDALARGAGQGQGLGGGRGGADKSEMPQPLADADFDPVVHKGDSLRLRYRDGDKDAKEAETLKVQEDGTISPKGKPVQVAGKTVGEVRAALEQSEAAGTFGGGATTRPATVNVERVASGSDFLRKDGIAGTAAPFRKDETRGQPTAADRVGEDQQQRRALDYHLAAASTTQPARLTDDTDEMVDVVIVVQKQPGALDTIAAPLNSITAAAASAPTTLPSASVRPHPTTQPAPASK